jgi:sulfate transport system ATP-binding protein
MDQAVAAIVRYVAAAGPTVRLELQREDTGQQLEAEITREQYKELQPQIGDRVAVTARSLRVFPGAEKSPEKSAPTAADLSLHSS